MKATLALIMIVLMAGCGTTKPVLPVAWEKEVHVMDMSENTEFHARYGLRQDGVMVWTGKQFLKPAPVPKKADAKLTPKPDVPIKEAPPPEPVLDTKKAKPLEPAPPQDEVKEEAEPEPQD